MHKVPTKNSKALARKCNVTDLIEDKISGPQSLQVNISVNIWILIDPQFAHFVGCTCMQSITDFHNMAKCFLLVKTSYIQTINELYNLCSCGNTHRCVFGFAAEVCIKNHLPVFGLFLMKRFLLQVCCKM